MSEGLLPVHGFVLAGGKSSRMGTDKALLEFLGEPLIKIAVEKLRTFCTEVSIAANRTDLELYAPVVREERLDVGPGGGIEAALKATQKPWVLCVPVDVPLLPAALLRRWAETCLEMGNDPINELIASYLTVGEVVHPAICMVHTDALRSISYALDRGEHSVIGLLNGVDLGEWPGFSDMDASRFAPVGSSATDFEFWFSNLNTPHEFDVAELWARTESR